MAKFRIQGKFKAQNATGLCYKHNFLQIVLSYALMHQEQIDNNPNTKTTKCQEFDYAKHNVAFVEPIHACAAEQNPKYKPCGRAFEVLHTHGFCKLVPFCIAHFVEFVSQS